MTVTDYSTGSSYKYGDKTGSWQSIIAEGGKVNSDSAEEPKSVESAPAVTATVDSIPVPWSGTHKETSSWVTPDVWPWVTTDSPSTSPTDRPGAYESSSGQIQPPTGGSMSEQYPDPSITSKNSIAKTGSSFPQSTSLSTPLPLVSSPAVFSPSGHDRKSSTPLSTHVHTHPTSTTSKTKHNWWGDVETDTSTAGNRATGTTISSSRAVSSGGNIVSPYGIPAAMGAFSALIGGILALL